MEETNFTCAILVAGDLGEKRALPRLRHIFLDADEAPENRWVAARSLGKLDAVNSKDILLAELYRAKPNDVAMKETVIKALAEVKDAQILSKVEQFLRGEPNPYLRERYEKSVVIMREKLRQPGLAAFGPRGGCPRRALTWYLVISGTSGRFRGRSPTARRDGAFTSSMQGPENAKSSPSFR